MSKRSNGTGYAVKLWFDWQEYEHYRSLSEDLLDTPVEKLFHSIIQQGMSQVVAQLSEQMNEQQEECSDETNNNIDRVSDGEGSSGSSSQN